MTDLRKAAVKALHALEDPNRDKHVANTADAIAALRQALAQPEPFSLVCTKCSADRTKEACKGDLRNCELMGYAQSAQPEQEPVAWVDTVWVERPDLAKEIPMNRLFSRCQLQDNQIPLHTAPVSKPCFDLSDDDTEALIEDLAEWSSYVEVDTAPRSLKEHVRQVLAALRSKKI